MLRRPLRECDGHHDVVPVARRDDQSVVVLEPFEEVAGLRSGDEDLGDDVAQVLPAGEHLGVESPHDLV